MEYASNLQSADREDTRPADLMSLRSHLQRQVERVRSIGHVVENIGDQVFGSVPVGIDSVAKSPESGPAPLVEIVADLERAVNRIESGLSRL